MAGGNATLSSNKLLFGLLVVLILLAIYYVFYRRFSKFNTSPVPVCETEGNCSFYNIHNLHGDRTDAANLMHEIVEDVDSLMEHLRGKYENSKFRGGVDPGKENRIDIIPTSGAYMGVEYAEDLYTTDYMQERIEQLFRRYNRQAIYEISPRNKSNLTSYTENKGEQLVLCLREKSPGPSGDNELHDKNTMIFVVCHELAHIMNDEWGHEEDFWKLFKVVLENAVECGIYTPVNYRVQPINYCGLVLNYNPLYDPHM